MTSVNWTVICYFSLFIDYPVCSVQGCKSDWSVCFCCKVRRKHSRSDQSIPCSCLCGSTVEHMYKMSQPPLYYSHLVQPPSGKTPYIKHLFKAATSLLQPLIFCPWVTVIDRFHSYYCHENLHY